MHGMVHACMQRLWSLEGHGLSDDRRYRKRGEYTFALGKLSWNAAAIHPLAKFSCISNREMIKKRSLCPASLPLVPLLASLHGTRKKIRIREEETQHLQGNTWREPGAADI
jgi:hypothetical protein